MFGAVRHTHQGEELQGALRGLGPTHARDEHRHHDILLGRELRK